MTLQSNADFSVHKMIVATLCFTETFCLIHRQTYNFLYCMFSLLPVSVKRTKSVLISQAVCRVSHHSLFSAVTKLTKRLSLLDSLPFLYDVSFSSLCVISLDVLCLQEIHLTISNEYTDWTRSPTSIHSTDIFESLVEVLSDATLVAPVIKTALIHERAKKKPSVSTYFYEFAHATERGDYPSHLGCINGDDLSYLFGAALVPGMTLGHFSTSFTKQETSFTEMVMTYFANFVRTG